MAVKSVVTVYGLSTEWYAMARQMAAGGAHVYIIDEATSSTTSLEYEIAKTYPNVLSLREDEPLLTVSRHRQPSQSPDISSLPPRSERPAKTSRPRSSQSSGMLSRP